MRKRLTTTRRHWLIRFLTLNLSTAQQSASAPSRAVAIGDIRRQVAQASKNVDAADCRELEASLRILGAQRMIVGHTEHEQITPRCGSRVGA